MESVVEEFNIIRPCVPWIFVQAVHVAFKGAIGEKAQSTRNFDRIVETLQRHIRLTKNTDIGQFAPMKPAFHSRERDRLVMRNHFGLLVSRRKSDQQRGDETCKSAGTQIE